MAKIIQEISKVVRVESIKLTPEGAGGCAGGPPYPGPGGGPLL